MGMSSIARVILIPDIKITGIYLRPSLLCLHPHLSAMKEYLFWKRVAEFLLFILPKNYPASFFASASAFV